MTRNRRWNQSAIVNNVANVGDWDMFWSSDIPFFSTVNIFPILHFTYMENEVMVLPSSCFWESYSSVVQNKEDKFHDANAIGGR